MTKRSNFLHGSREDAAPSSTVSGKTPTAAFLQESDESQPDGSFFEVDDHFHDAEEEVDAEAELGEHEDIDENDIAEDDAVEDDLANLDAPATDLPGWAGVIATIAGLTVAVAGVALTYWWSDATALRGTLESLGVAPMHLIVVGLVLWGMAAVQRRVRHNENKLVSLLAAAQDADHGHRLTQEQLSELATAGTPNGSSSETSGVLLEVLHLVKRQDEKINNLSKATKMYGTPLLEMSKQLADTAHRMSELNTTIQTVKVIVEQSSSRIETTMRQEMSKIESGDFDPKELERIAATNRQSLARLQVIQDDLGRKVEGVKNDLSEGLTREIGQLEQLIAETHQATTAAIESQPSAAPAAASPEMAQALAKLQSGLDALTSTVANLQLAPTSAAAATEPQDATDKPAGAANIHSAIAKLKEMRQ